MDRKLSAILAADVVGYSALMERDEAGTFERLRAGRKELFEPEIARHHGHIFKLMGDGLLAEFGGVVDAVECAVSLQRGLAERNASVPEAERHRVRIGINLGEVIVEGEDRYGDAVNIAARLQQLAEPGGICVSGKVAKEVEKKLAFGFESMGDQRVKNIAEPIPAFKVRLDGLHVRAPIAPRIRLRSLVATMAVVVAVAVGVTSGWWFFGRMPVATITATPSIVVLPFDNLSDDKEQGYLADGITEDLTTELAGVPGLFVISRNAAFAYRDKGLPPGQIASELKVHFILEGSVRRAGNDIRINAQLIDAASDGHIWAERYDGAWSDIFALQNKVVGNIASALKLRLIEDRNSPDVLGGTRNPAAYEVFLRGLEREYRGESGDWSAAISFYQQALKLDPEFGRATARLATVYWNAAGQVPVQKELGLSDDSVWGKFTEYLEEASKHPSPTYYQLRADQLIYKHRSGEATAAAERAVALDPSDPDGYSQLAIALTFDGRAAEALDTFDTLMRVEPKWTPWRRYLVGIVYFAMNRLNDAAANLEKLDPEIGTSTAYFWPNYQGRWLLVSVYAHLGRLSDASRVLAELKPYIAQTDDRELTGLMAMGPFPFRNYADLGRVLEGLHKAGVPDLPYGYDQLGTRLSGQEVAALLFGSENEGRDLNWGDQSSGKILKDGTFYAHVGDWRETGRSWIEGDALCLDFPSQFRRCAAVLKNPGGTFEKRNEYLFVHPWARFEFSITKRLED